MTPPAGASVTQLFKAHAPALLLYARQWLDAAMAEDIVQEVFVRLLTGQRVPSEPRTWLYRCVRNASISAWRSNRRRTDREQASKRESLFIPKVEDLIDAEAAQEALARLPQMQREIVTLRIWSDLALAEIKEITGLPISTIHDQYRCALKEMREQLERTWRKTSH
jgi:RNA polymerase sigma-70 factor (ECF subfamily)